MTAPEVISRTAKLFAPDGESADFLGYSVALSGDTAIVAAPLNSLKTVSPTRFGLATDRPTLADYDGDGKADMRFIVATANGMRSGRQHMEVYEYWNRRKFNTRAKLSEIKIRDN